MSLVDGCGLVVYQGASARRSARPAGLWPVVAYQVTAMAWQAIPNGIVRSTARAVRLPGLPGAEDLLRVFYRDLNGPARGVSFDYLHGVASCSVVTRAMPRLRPGLSRTRTTLTGREPKTEYHRHVTAAAWTVSVLS
jgi:hypothetical protein